MEIKVFANYIIICIALTAAILILNLWFSYIRKSNLYLIEFRSVNSTNVKNISSFQNYISQDYGLLYISLALFIWTLIGLVKLLNFGPLEGLIISILSTVNSMFFLISTLYLQYTNDFIKQERNYIIPNIIFISFLTICTTFVFYYFEPIHTSLPDFILSSITVLTLGYLLLKTFWKRNLKIVAIFSSTTMLLLILTQSEISNLFFKEMNTIFLPLIVIYAKTSFMFIICLLAISWSQENLNVINKKVDELKTSIEKQKHETENAWKDIALRASHRIGIPINRLHLFNNLAIKELRGNNKKNTIVELLKMGEFIEDAKKVLKDFQQSGNSSTLKLQKADLIKIINSSRKRYKQDEFEFNIHNATKSMKTIKNYNSSSELVVHFKEEDSLEITIDPEKIKDCFDELISNSTHFFDKENKEINIELEILKENNSNEKVLKIVYADNGIGIQDDRKEKIFEHFYSSYIHGTGIGMSIVKKNIEQHLGTIVEKGIWGEGSKFEIHLPLK